MSSRRFTVQCLRASTEKDSTTGGSAALRDFDPAYVRFGSGADITRLLSNVRFTPQSGQRGLAWICLLCAITGLMQCSKTTRYSITSSARSGNAGGMLRPSARAVLRLTTSSYFVGACTGSWPGFSPRKMRLT